MIFASKLMSIVGDNLSQKSNYKDHCHLSLFILEFVGKEVKTCFPFLVINQKIATASNVLNWKIKIWERLKYYNDTSYNKKVST